MTSPVTKWFLPAIATLAVVGGTMVGAGALDGADPVLDEPVTTTTDVTTPTHVPDDGAPSASDPADDETDGDSGDRSWGPECGDGEPTSHGQFVSGSEHGGAARSEAAHSSCGKPIEDGTEVGDEDGTEVGDDDGTEVDDDDGTEVDDDDGTEVDDDDGTEVDDDDGTEVDDDDDAPGHSEGHGPH